jgi:signal peptide peptidase SppA
MTKLAHIADRVLNRPLMILPDKLSLIASVLAGRIGIDAAALADKPTVEGAVELQPEASRFVGEYQLNDPDNPRAGRKPYKQTSDGVAVIPVLGSLVNRGSFLDALSGMTSYESIKNAVARAVADDSVPAIVFDIDSPGGEAVGAFEVAEVIRAAGNIKPTATSVTGLCCSAAYAIASATQKIVVSTSSIAGSIGVVMMHADQSHRLHDAGVVPTLIYAGAHKVDGNPLEKLSDGVKAELKTELTRFYDLFVSTVAQGRTAMTEETIRATEARTYIGADAVAVGLADEVGSFESVLADLTGGASRNHNAARSARTNGKTAMKTYSETEYNAAVAAARIEGVTAGKVEGAAEATAAATAATAAATTTAAATERDRIKAILALDEAKGRDASAQHLATATTMSVDDAKALLATMPKSGASARGLDANLGLSLVDTGEGQKPVDASAAWDKIAAKQNAHLA